MKTEIKVVSAVEKVRAMFPIVPKKPDDEWEWENLEVLDLDEMKEIAKQVGVNVSVIEGFKSVVADLRDALEEDLASIWKRQDELEKQIKELRGKA